MSLFPASNILLSNLIDLFLNSNKPEKDPRKKVVVIGYGWGGKSFCDKINQTKYNVTVISKTNYMLNTPKLKNSLINDHDNLKQFPENKINLIHEECSDIVMSRNMVKVGDKNINYDYLILAVGSEVNDFNIKGVKENCFFLKNVEDLYKLKEKIGTLNPNSQIVILGAGAVGIELAFQMKKIFKNIQILEGADKILPMYKDQSTKIILEELKNENIKLILNNQVKLVDKDIITTNNSKYNYDLAIFACGIKSNPLIQKITKDRILKVDSNLKFNENIFAIGDIVASKETGPPTAQNADQQGKYLANYFNNDMKGNDYVYSEKGKIIHCKENMLLETQFGSSRISNILENLIDKFIG